MQESAPMEKRIVKKIVFIAAVWGFAVVQVFAQSAESVKATEAAVSDKEITLVRASMCEKIKEYEPVNEAVVFSIDIGKVSCFTAFDHIPETTFVFHKWYRRDKLNAKKRLILRPPRWSTFSSIQLREVDKGPWRVEITDPEENILKILRFSITD